MARSNLDTFLNQRETDRGRSSNMASREDPRLGVIKSKNHTHLSTPLILNLVQIFSSPSSVNKIKKEIKDELCRVTF